MNALLKGLPPGVQFLLFMALTLTSMGIGSVTAMGIGVAVYSIPLEQLPVVLAHPTPEYAEVLMWMNNVTQVFTFLLPVIFFFLLFGGKSVNHLLLKKGGVLVLLAPVLMFFANGIIDISAKINKALIPENSMLERAFKPTEEIAERITKLMLDVDTTVPMWVTFLSIAIIPALFEELSFRGVVQPLLAKITGNVHIAIWITAALFSLIHVQFYGFLPRMLMGALLGYLVIWSGSLWASILAHFVNNALAIVLYRQFGSLETPVDATMNQWYSYLFSAVLFTFLMVYFIRNSKWPRLSFAYLGIAEKISLGHEEIRKDLSSNSDQSRGMTD